MNNWVNMTDEEIVWTCTSASSLVCGSASELPRAMDACNSPEKSNEMSFYDNTPLSSPLPCSISPSESSLMLHENLPTDFTITPSSDIERRPFSEVVFNTLDTSATTKSACRKLKFIEPSGTAPKRMDSPRTPTTRLSPKNLGSIFHPLNSIGESSNSNDDYDMELLEMDAMEDHDNLPPANFDSVIHGQMTHPPLRRGVSLNESTTSSRRNRQSLSSDGLEGVSALGENSPPFVMHGFKRSERGVCSPINSKRWKSEMEGKENVPQARPVLQKSFSMIDSSLNIMKALEKADLGLIGDHSKPFCLPITNGKQRDLTCISVHTMARLLNGDYKNAVNSYRVIDCRYPYEFEGGHIRGAENLYTEDDIYRVLMSTKTETATVVPVEPKRNIIIFHCEFSSHRGPKLAKFLRTKDRDANNDIYPALHYPEIYLLDGGYKEFFKYYTDLCDPKTYLPMLEPAYDSYYKHFRAATKSWNGGDRVTLSRTGKSRSRLLL
ncbi:M-phase inducer phosphatase-like isoform X2 [Bradysia coprophila]|uniref:M-phase inducer phosphatase-like isoform X2 n=1 Tax=Bradysia coprophila TaxID=38358 RepID=UPI00187DD19C|nr:M-phase inducer phosphatase-like isoform X2 [Bradysia coprophila]